MIVLFKKNLNLFVKVKMELRLPVKYQNKVFGKGLKEELLLPDEVEFILTRNGNIRLWNGEKYVKLNLGQFYDIMKHKRYIVEEVKEPKKEVKVEQIKPAVVKEEPKQEVKPAVVKEEPKQVEVKKEEVKEQLVENKKQRHNKQQGGSDK